jgi:hypothetical protein
MLNTSIFTPWSSPSASVGDPSIVALPYLQCSIKFNNWIPDYDLGNDYQYKPRNLFFADYTLRQIPAFAGMTDNARLFIDGDRYTNRSRI